MGFENFNPINQNAEKQNILDKIPDYYNDRCEELNFETILETMKAITAEWKKEDRDERVRSKEISLALRLPKIQIPEDKKEEFLKVAKDFIHGLMTSRLVFLLRK